MPHERRLACDNDDDDDADDNDDDDDDYDDYVDSQARSQMSCYWM